ncbi:hypothetical protein M422DRAFT_35391 [Sphaerobolus stellatus SS14]|uniref:Uncharacterized protein n=1 Tax=Sphaerobolus stellatus (strain SS14) TaxID=990650 RepID=A0A0C9UG35_SPHS4|nr:hypothetical protein M422DRAFT_35391 [Sphaerobolus stellatus SS14]
MELMCQVISRCIQDPSDLIQTNGFLSVLLLHGVSIDSSLCWMLDKSNAVNKLRNGVLTNFTDILSKTRLNDNPYLLYLIPSIFTRFLETRGGINWHYAHPDTEQYKILHSYGIGLFEYFMFLVSQARDERLQDDSFTEYALWGLYLVISPPKVGLTYAWPAVDLSALTRLQVDLASPLLRFIRTPGTNEDLLGVALFVISSIECDLDAYTPQAQAGIIRNVTSIILGTESSFVKHASILALEALSSRLHEETLDLFLCTDISKPLIDLFQYQQDYPEGSVSIPVNDVRHYFPPMIRLGSQLRFPTVGYLRILGRLLKCRDWNPQFWDEGHYRNCVMHPSVYLRERYTDYIGAFHSADYVDSLYQEEIIKLVIILPMDMELWCRIPGDLNDMHLFRRWEFMVSLANFFRRSPTYLNTPEFQARFLSLLAYTIFCLGVYNVSNALQRYVFRLLELLSVDHDGGRDTIMMGPPVREAVMEETVERDNIAADPDRHDEKALQKHLVLLTRSLLRRLQVEDDYYYHFNSQEINAHIEVCRSWLRLVNGDTDGVEQALSYLQNCISTHP